MLGWNPFFFDLFYPGAISIGARYASPLMRAALSGLVSFDRMVDHMRRIQFSQSPMWDTALTVLALREAGRRRQPPRCGSPPRPAPKSPATPRPDNAQAPAPACQAPARHSTATKVSNISSMAQEEGKDTGCQQGSQRLLLAAPPAPRSIDRIMPVADTTSLLPVRSKTSDAATPTRYYAAWPAHTRDDPPR